MPAYFSIPLCDLHCLARFRSSVGQGSGVNAANVLQHHRVGKVPLSSRVLFFCKSRGLLRAITQRIRIFFAESTNNTSTWIITNFSPPPMLKAPEINKKTAIKCAICKAHWTTGSRHRTEPHAQTYQSDWPKDRQYDWEAWESEDQSWQWPMRGQPAHSERAYTGSQSLRTLKGSQSPRGRKGKGNGKGKFKGT